MLNALRSATAEGPAALAGTRTYRTTVRSSAEVTLLVSSRPRRPWSTGARLLTHNTQIVEEDIPELTVHRGPRPPVAVTATTGRRNAPKPVPHATKKTPKAKADRRKRKAPREDAVRNVAAHRPVAKGNARARRADRRRNVANEALVDTANARQIADELRAVTGMLDRLVDRLPPWTYRLESVSDGLAALSRNAPDWMGTLGRIVGAPSQPTPMTNPLSGSTPHSHATVDHRSRSPTLGPEPRSFPLANQEGPLLVADQTPRSSPHSATPRPQVCHSGSTPIVVPSVPCPSSLLRLELPDRESVMVLLRRHRSREIRMADYLSENGWTYLSLQELGPSPFDTQSLITPAHLGLSVPLPTILPAIQDPAIVSVSPPMPAPLQLSSPVYAPTTSNNKADDQSLRPLTEEEWEELVELDKQDWQKELERAELNRVLGDLARERMGMTPTQKGKGRANSERNHRVTIELLDEEIE